jgi:hypothetical protein
MGTDHIHCILGFVPRLDEIRTPATESTQPGLRLLSITWHCDQRVPTLRSCHKWVLHGELAVSDSVANLSCTLHTLVAVNVDGFTFMRSKTNRLGSKRTG